MLNTNMLLRWGQGEAQAYLVTCDCPGYLKKAERRLAEEKERVANYLDQSSEPKILCVVETELIHKQVRRSPAFLAASFLKACLYTALWDWQACNGLANRGGLIAADADSVQCTCGTGCSVR